MATVQKSAALVVPVVVVAATVFVGNGCAQLIGWEEPYLLPDAGTQDGGGEGGLGGAGGNGGAGGLGGGGGAGGKPECTEAADCPAGMNGQATCTGGVCGFTCTDGYGDCDGALGCEENLVDNRSHCGACGNQCVAQCKGMACNDPVSIAGGYQHFCAILKDGELYCWGRNEKGELGDGTFGTKLVPTKVKLPAGTTAVQVAGGGTGSAGAYNARTCAVLNNGKLACWGDGVNLPTVLGTISNVKMVAVGNSHNCAVGTNSKLYCWGGNLSGQVGNNNTSPVANPTEIISGVMQVSAGASHTCAVMIGGTVQCWGGNSRGQLGIGNTMDKLIPTSVAGLSLVDQVACGNEHTCSRSSAGMFCWGSNAFGQLGIGDYNQQNSPQTVNLSQVSMIALGYGNSGAIDSGTIWMWGNNSQGKLGTGNSVESTVPKKLSLVSAKMIATAPTSTCGLVEDGRVYCWGSNTYGQLGNGSIVGEVAPKLMVWP